MVRDVNRNDLNEILQLYLYLHEESIPDETSFTVFDKIGRKVWSGRYRCNG